MSKPNLSFRVQEEVQGGIISINDQIPKAGLSDPAFFGILPAMNHNPAAPTADVRLRYAISNKTWFSVSLQQVRLRYPLLTLPQCQSFV